MRGDILGGTARILLQVISSPRQIPERSCQKSLRPARQQFSKVTCDAPKARYPIQQSGVTVKQLSRTQASILLKVRFENNYFT